MVRDELPKVKAPGKENACTLNHWLKRDCADPERPALMPVRFGRCPAPKPLVLVATLIGSGLPDWKVVIPFMPQPEASLPATPVRLPPIGWPLPKGKSRI